MAVSITPMSNSITTPCRFCTSGHVRVFSAEMNIHFPGMENVTKPSVMAVPPVTICLNCGCADFVVHGEPLEQLRDRSFRARTPMVSPTETNE